MASAHGSKPNYALRRAVAFVGAVTLIAVLVVGIIAVVGGQSEPGSVSGSPVSAVAITSDITSGIAADIAVVESAPIGLTPQQLADATPNEIGVIPVLEYHLIESGKNSDYSRTPEAFRADLEWLVGHDYFPIRFRDLTSGRFDVPAGKSPVVLTFDDSSIGQFRILDDGTVDPLSAMGIMLDVARQHAQFPAVATFFPLLDVDVDSRILWGQPDLVDNKLRTIIESGGEIGSHTVSHERLDQADADRVRWQLATSCARLHDRIAGITGLADAPYEIVSLALPFGKYPADETLVRSGSADGRSYEFSGVAEVAGGPTVSPFAGGFDRYHITRTQAIDGYLDGVFEQLIAHPELVFVSDGNPDVITVPTEATLAEGQRNTFAAPTGWPDNKIVRYDRT